MSEWTVEGEESSGEGSEVMRGETETYLNDGKDDDETKGDCNPSL